MSEVSESPKGRPAAIIVVLVLVGAVGAALWSARSSGTDRPDASELGTAVHRCVPSAADPETLQPQHICYTLFRPAGVSDAKPAPLILAGQGWGTPRAREPKAFEPWLEAGYGVMSFDPRGTGESGGKSYLQNPDVEGKDLQALLGVVRKTPWVKTEAPGDPLIGAIGPTYGGDLPLLAAFSNVTTSGESLIDAIAPEIVWWDLSEAYAPGGVVRTKWTQSLLASGADAINPTIEDGLKWANATGAWPGAGIEGVPNLEKLLDRNGPKWQVAQGRQLDLPVLMAQGVVDNRFTLRQGMTVFEKALTPQARARSMFIGYNEGHVQISTVPPGTGVDRSDPCSRELVGEGGFTELAVSFMDEQLLGEERDLEGYGEYHVAASAEDCVTVSSVDKTREFPVATLTVDTANGDLATEKIADGPLTVAGLPELRARMDFRGPGARSFYALSIGASAADARVIHSSVTPVAAPRNGVVPNRKIDLPAVVVEVPQGQSLFLTVSPASDMFGGTSGFTPGKVTLDRVRVSVPVVD